MTWNWQQPDWPDFRWDERKLVRAEAAFIENAGIFIGASKHLDEDDHQSLRIELLSHEAVDTSAIEGEHLDRASVQSSIQRQMGLTALPRRSSTAEAGIAELMVHLYQNLSTPLTDEGLYQWHRLTMSGRS